MTYTDEQQTAPPRSLGSAVTRALGWSTMAQILGRVFNLGIGLVLARLLTKEDFGVYAVALVAINLLIVVNDLGIISAIIRWQGDVRKVAGTAATVSLVFSGFVFTAAFLGAPAFAEAMGSPEATNLVRVIAIAILVDGWSAVPQAVIVREFRNDRLAFAELGGFFAGVPVTIGMAIAGAGPWSIVAGRVVTSVVVAGIVVISAPYRVRPSWDRAAAVALVRFGAPLALSAVVFQAVLNVDYIVVGRALGSEDLGVYLLAFNLSSWPANIITTAVARVAFAGFSRLAEDRGRLATAIPRAIGVAMAVLVPMVTMLAVLAPEVIEFLYGKKWSAAATPLRFLIVLGGMRIVMDLLVDLTIADGRPRTALAVRSAWLVAVIPALALGAEADALRGVGIAHVVVAGAVVLPLLLADARRSGVRTVDLGRQAVRPLLSGAAATLTAVALVPLVPGVVPRLVVAGGAGVLVYLVTFVPRNPLVQWAAARVRAGRRPGRGVPEQG